MTYDLFIIGGGINGSAVARDAAGRGLKVGLAEQNDLASATSSASTKLIHGGLRYLEHYEFKLVSQALGEREVLLRAAPHIIWPLRFVLPHHEGLRPTWMIRLGLFLYDHLGGRKILSATRSVNLETDPAGQPLKAQFRRGFEYSDCWVDDARFVVLNCRDAADRGADIFTRTKCVEAKRGAEGWEITLQDKVQGLHTVTSKALVNASGPWVNDVLNQVIGYNETAKIRMVKGSHLVVDKLFSGERCYIFQNGDGRICFAIPYQRDFTLIGTTDEDFDGDPASPHISDEERDYLLAAVSEYLRQPIKAAQIRWSYSGVRPLLDDGSRKAQEATRDYVLKLEGDGAKAPLLSVFGGKITTSRKLGEAAVEKLAPFFPHLKPAWTAGAHLPGGDFPYTEVEPRIADLQRRFSFLKPHVAARLFHAYGTYAEKILGDARFAADLGQNFGELSEREIDYLRQKEWAVTAEDILWRRSKLGLHLSPEDQVAVAEFLKPKTELEPVVASPSVQAKRPAVKRKPKPKAAGQSSRLPRQKKTRP